MKRWRPMKIPVEEISEVEVRELVLFIEM